MFKSLLAFILLFTSFSSVEADELYFPTFHEGVLRGGKAEPFFKHYFKTKKEKAAYEKEEKLFSDIYENAVAIIRSRKEVDELTIPKIIHVIWLGSEIPEKYSEWQQTWKDLEGWEYRLWTDKEVESLTLINRDLYDSSTNYGEKSDILRLEILYQFGGLYVDTDFACINPAYFEAFHHSLDFYIGTEPINCQSLKIGNALIGSSPRHPFLEKLITLLPSNHSKYKKRNMNNTVEMTGPGFISRVAYDYIISPSDSSWNVSIFPPSFFYPLSPSELIHKKRKGGLIIDADLLPETCGIHYWDGSWFKTPPK